VLYFYLRTNVVTVVIDVLGNFFNYYNRKDREFLGICADVYRELRCGGVAAKRGNNAILGLSGGK
jgi:hypothetical protein